MFKLTIALTEFEEGGDTATFERCGFRDNMAGEVGAALGVASRRFFGNKENSSPLRLVNW